uniref:Carnosine dipeptidase 2 n=1 Tax=Rousettus aegyptiacus TaxID=9407 RepID=A0A7J8DFK4_ROUAE|nr:carnosine dipeptidase 2 [Rousettus aegyptiacus]
MSALTTLFKYVDENQDRYIKKLADWVAIQSVSAWPEKRGEIRRMMEVAAGDIKQLGGSVELVDIGKQKLPDGSEIPLPPILLGKLGSNPQEGSGCPVPSRQATHRLSRVDSGTPTCPRGAVSSRQSHTLSPGGLQVTLNGCVPRIGTA